MSILDLPEPERTRFSELDEPALRERLKHWDDGMRVVLPVKLVRTIAVDLDVARARGNAARDAMSAWGGAVLEVAGALGVVTRTGDSLESITARTLAEVQTLRQRLRDAEVEASEHRRTRSLLDTVVGWGLR